MSRKQTSIALAAALMVLGAVAAAQQFQPETMPFPSPVQVIQPEIRVLDRPLILELQVDPDLGTSTSMRILCATSLYRGEVHEERQDARIRLSVSGEIQELSEGKILISFDAEAQSDDANGGKGFAGSGAAILKPGQPKSVLTIGGRSLFLTVRYPPEEAGAPTQGK